MQHKSYVFSISPLLLLSLSAAFHTAPTATETADELRAEERKCIAKNLDRLGNIYACIVNYDGNACRDENNELSVFDELLKGRLGLCSKYFPQLCGVASHPRPGDEGYHEALVEFQAAAKRLFMLDNIENLEKLSPNKSMSFDVTWPTTNPSLAVDGDLQTLGGEGGKTGSVRLKHKGIPEIMVKRRLKDEEEANLMSWLLVDVGSCSSTDGLQAYTVQERVGGQMARLRMRSRSPTKPHSSTAWDLKGLWYTNDDKMQILSKVITDRMAYTVINNSLGRGLLDGMVSNHQEGYNTQMEATLEFLTNLKQDTEFLGSETKSQDYSWFAISEEMDANRENEEMCKAANGILVRAPAEAQKDWMSNFTEKNEGESTWAKVGERVFEEGAPLSAYKRRHEEKRARASKDLKEKIQKLTAPLQRLFGWRKTSNDSMCEEADENISGAETTTEVDAEINAETTIEVDAEVDAETTTQLQSNGEDQNPENGMDELAPVPTSSIWDDSEVVQTTITSTAFRLAHPGSVSMFCVHSRLIDFYGGFNLKARSESKALALGTAVTSGLSRGKESMEKLQRAIGSVEKDMKKEIQDLEKEREARRADQVSNDEIDHDADDHEDAEEHLNKLRLMGNAMVPARHYLNTEMQQTQIASSNYSERLYSTLVVQLFRLGDVMEKFNEY